MTSGVDVAHDHEIAFAKAGAFAWGRLESSLKMRCWLGQRDRISPSRYQFFACEQSSFDQAGHQRAKPSFVVTRSEINRGRDALHCMAEPAQPR